jgi:hypothetical protein
MDNDSVKAIQTLRDVNDALVMGLEGAIYYMEKWDEMTPQGRKSIIEKLKALIAQSSKYYGEGPTEH